MSLMSAGTSALSSSSSNSYSWAYVFFACGWELGSLLCLRRWKELVFSSFLGLEEQKIGEVSPPVPDPLPTPEVPIILFTVVSTPDPVPPIPMPGA